jgi:hypothetical protein
MTKLSALGDRAGAASRAARSYGLIAQLLICTYLGRRGGDLINPQWPVRPVPPSESPGPHRPFPQPDG